MTATDLTGFYAFVSSQNRAIFSTFWGHFLTKLHSQPGEKGKDPLERVPKKSSGDGAPKLQRNLSLVVAERGLISKEAMTMHSWKSFQLYSLTVSLVFLI